MHGVVLRDGACAAGTCVTRTSPSQGGHDARGFVIEHVEANGETVRMRTRCKMFAILHHWIMIVLGNLECFINALTRRLVSRVQGVNAESFESTHCGAGALRNNL